MTLGANTNSWFMSFPMLRIYKSMRDKPGSSRRPAIELIQGPPGPNPERDSVRPCRQ